MSIAIYSRKSCLTDKGESIKNQIDMCKQYVYAHIYPKEKCKFIIYKDEGFSAKNTDRPEFKKMISDSEKGKFSHIVCYRLDRISRNVGDFSHLIEKFNKLNISFICIKEQFDTSVPMGRAMMYMASVFAQLERETIAERVKDNMLMLSKSGRWLGGPPPLGFDSHKIFNDKTKKYEYYLESNENDIKKVKKIYSKFLENHSLSKTKQYLDSVGLTSKLENSFSIPAIKKILTNPVYCTADSQALNYFKKSGTKIYYGIDKFDSSRGIITYNKRNYCKNHGAKNPICDWVVSIGTHKGIISGGNWIKANNILRRNNKHKKHDNN